MILKAKGIYRCPQFDLIKGQRTDELPVEVSLEKLTQMITDFPTLFEVIEDKAKEPVKPSPEFKIENKEDKLKIETPEKKMGRPSTKGK